MRLGKNVPEAKTNTLITVNDIQVNTENQMTHFPFKENLLIALRAVLVGVNCICLFHRAGFHTFIVML